MEDDTSDKEGIRNSSAGNGGNSIREQTEPENEESFQSSASAGGERGNGESVTGVGKVKEDGDVEKAVVVALQLDHAGGEKAVVVSPPADGVIEKAVKKAVVVVSQPDDGGGEKAVKKAVVVVSQPDDGGGEKAVKKAVVVVSQPDDAGGEKAVKKAVVVVSQPDEGGGEKGRLVEDVGGTGCFGVRSYLHQFYDAEKTPQIYEDFVEEDDFEYLVDPGKRRARWCCWFRWCTWSGANLLLIGIITLLVGYLTPKRDVVVGYHDHLEILDRWAITFNQRLELCRVAGLVIFCVGAVVVVVALMISACGNNNDRRRYERSFTYVTTAAVGEPTYKQGGVNKIPITEEIKPVQPVGDDAGTEGGKDRAIVVQMPYY